MWVIIYNGYGNEEEELNLRKTAKGEFSQIGKWFYVDCDRRVNDFSKTGILEEWGKKWES